MVGRVPHAAALLWVLVAAAPESRPEHPLRHHLVGDGLTTGALGVGWLSSEFLFKESLAPEACRWCDRAPDGTDTLNPVDRWGRGLRGAPDQLLFYDTASGVAVGVVAAAVLGTHLGLAASSDALEALALDLLIIGEALGLAMVVNQAVKFAAGRERPFVHGRYGPEEELTRQPSDANLSFFSGHSNLAFTLAVATGTVARLRGYRRAWLVWAIGLPFAASVPLLRMAADRHYLTDVFVGSLFGAAVGFGLPTLLHPRVEGASPRGARLTVVPTPGGLALAGLF